MEPIPVHLGGQALKEGVALVVGLKVRLGLLLGDKLRPGHIGDGLDVVLEGPGLLLGESVLDIGCELVLLLQARWNMLEAFTATRVKEPMMSRQQTIMHTAAKDMKPWVKMLCKPSLKK